MTTTYIYENLGTNQDPYLGDSIDVRIEGTGNQCFICHSAEALNIKGIPLSPNLSSIPSSP
jgi:hypothetical protein